MSTTFKFEELDETTHDYLVAVRDSGGLGSPGVFASTKDTLPGCGCIAGPIVVIATLLLTLVRDVGIIYDDPVGVALLQTAGLLVGGWLIAAGFRGGKGTDKVAGTWVYVDPLFLYEAYREQITVTPVEEVVEASFTHNYNNGAYQNSVVSISTGGNRVTTVTFANEARAEQMVVYLNYLAWARGPDGGDRANLAPATLGGLAKYVAKNDHEPLDTENNINLNLIELDITQVPEEPTREGRAMPSVLPYIFLLLYATACFFIMAFIVNPPLRDDAIFEAVMKEPSVEPRFLRAYLIDPRNTKHRDEVTKKLSGFYNQPIAHVRQNGKDVELREGMAKLLESLRTADQPVVSVRVTEVYTPAGQEGKKADRQNQVRTDFAVGVNAAFSQFMPPVSPPPDVVFKETPPPVGEQLMAFIEAPEGADRVHFDITYTVEQAGDSGLLRLAVVVEIRTNIEDKDPTARSQFLMSDQFGAASLDDQVKKLKEELVSRMIGVAKNQGFGIPINQPPGGF